MRALSFALAVTSLGSPAWCDEELAVSRYDLSVVVHPEKLSVRAVLTTRMQTLRLELAPEMEVRGATATGQAVPCKREGSLLTVDLARVSDGSSEVRLEMDVDGAPREQFSQARGGFLRSAVTPERTWVRGQVAWYPRVADGRASYRVIVDVPHGWKACTGGRPQPVVSRERDTWTFETDGAVRGIGLVAGPYDVREAQVSERARMAAWTLPGDETGGPRLLDIAKRAFDHYGSRFGEVAVAHFALVEMPASFGEGSGYGEEGYVLIGSGAFARGASAPWADALVAHEVAHTWWGNEVAFAHFASESLASYATLGFLEKTAGEEAARQERSRAVERVVEAADRGREIALADIRGFGAGMDPEAYRVHAYEKGMMLLVMVEDAIGRESLDRALRGFLEANRGRTVGYPELRKALSATGSAARAVIEQWEQPGIPRLALDHSSKRVGKKWQVRGTVTQEGTRRPFRMQVKVLVRGGEETSEMLTLSGKSAKFRMTVSEEPAAIVLDPDFRLLVAAPRSPATDAKGAIEEAFAVVSNPGEGDESKCEHAIALLRGVLERGAGEQEGLCQVGIGRCLFRLGKLDEAEKALVKALELGAGGPFHRAWAELRLGCIADMRHKREDALAHYRNAQGRGASAHTARLAGRFIEHPYRSYALDG